MRFAILSLSFAAALAAAQEPKDDKAPKARELDVKDLKVEASATGLLKPKKITSEKELAEEIKDKVSRDAVAKKVDFDKEYVLLFKWSGSGGDKLSMTVKKDTTGKEDAVFTVTRGLTRDLRPHIKLFAVPKGIGHKMGT